LYNKDKKKFVIKDREDDFNLKGDSDETIFLSFKLDDPDDFEEDDTYAFYVWAEAEDRNVDPEQDICVWASDSVEIIIENDFVVLDNFVYPDTVLCGSQVEISAEVWNIGDSDQDSVSVSVHDKFKELGISELKEVGDIDAFDSVPVSFILDIPQDAEEKTYTLIFEVYDEDGDKYQNDYNDDYAEFVLPLTVQGGCIVVPTVSISANLVSGGMEGENLVVQATLTNTGDKIKEYTVNAEGYSSWASSVSIDKQTFSLGPGESTEVTFDFEVNEGVSGDQLFNIEVYSDGKLEFEQPVQVSITEKPNFLKGLRKFASFNKENWYIWVLGILNVILIVAIVVIAVKLKNK